MLNFMSMVYFKSKIFADESTFALNGTFNSSRELIECGEAFKSVSGLKLNNSETLLLNI